MPSEKIKTLLGEIASAVLWIAQKFSGAYKLSAKEKRELLALCPPNGPARPAGLRDILNPEHPVAKRMRDCLNRFGIEVDGSIVPAPTDRESLRAYVAARLPQLFDQPERRDRSKPLRQADAIREAYLHIAGWDFEDVVAVFQFAWDNAGNENRGRSAFKHLWHRELTSFLTSMQASAGTQNEHLTPAFIELQKRMGGLAALEVVRHIAEDVFEIERGMDCLNGLSRNRALLRKAKKRDRILFQASASPFLIATAETRQELIKSGDHEQQAALAGETAARMTTRKRGLERDRNKTKAFYLGGNDLEFALHLFSEIGRRKVERFGRASNVHEHDRLESRIFRLAINLISVDEPERARDHLKKRLNEEGEKKAASVAHKASLLDLSFFEIPSNAVSTDERLGPLAVVLENKHIGASYVETFREELKEQKDQGLLDEIENPAVRAFFYPRGWTHEVTSPVLLSARSQYQSELSILDPSYTAIGSFSQLDMSAVFAGRLLECVVAPLTLRAFAVQLPEPKVSNASADMDGDRSSAPANVPITIESGPEHAQKSGLTPDNAKTRNVSKLLLSKET